MLRAPIVALVVLAACDGVSRVPPQVPASPPPFVAAAPPMRAVAAEPFTCAADSPERVELPPPFPRVSLPQLVATDRGYEVAAYGGPAGKPLQWFHTALATGASTVVGQGACVVAAAASDGTIGVSYLADDRRTYVTALAPDGSVAVPPVALGEVGPHNCPGNTIVWNGDRREWGVTWHAKTTLHFARLAADGHAIAERALGDYSAYHDTRLVWTGTAYAYVAKDRDRLLLLEIDDTGVRTTALATDHTLEPAVAFAGGMFHVVVRGWPSRDLQLVRIRDGQILDRTVIAHTADPQMLLTPVLAASGDELLLVWSVSHGGFDDRLWFARLGLDGRAAQGFPVALDATQAHQGYASLTAGTATCEPAVAYIIGDPNGDDRIVVRRLPTGGGTTIAH